MRKAFVFLLLALLSSPGFGQGAGDITILFESDPGFSLEGLLDSVTVASRHRDDLNLDGTPDLTLLSHDAQDNPTEVVTVDVSSASENILWRYPYEDLARALGTQRFRFLGFFSFGTSGRHALFRAPNGGTLAIIAILVGKNRAADPIVIPANRLAVLDIDGDDGAEIVVQNPQTRTVQVYGSMTSTATEDEIEAALGPLLQSYPNPFHDATTIAYHVDQPGPVTVTIYDLRGRRVRTLVDENQGAGAYRVSWDGRDAGGQPVASGMYFYRLRVGEAVSSQQAIRLR